MNFFVYHASPEMVNKILVLWENGYTIDQIAEITGLTFGQVTDVIKYNAPEKGSK